MPYSAEVSRGNPSCFLFLIDQSGSMADSWGGGTAGQKKADGVADVINRFLQNLTIRCAKAEGVRDYYDVGVIAYGAQAGPAFAGALAGKDLVAISEVAMTPARIEERTKKESDGAGGVLERTVKFPVWFDPVASGGTPMCQALGRAHMVLSRWLQQHPSCFPPIVINITDGEPTDGDPTAAAESLMQLSSADGNALLFNVHISSHGAAPIEFPDNDEALPDEHARLLFKISSRLPEVHRSAAAQEGIPVSENTRGFAFNADMVSLVRFLDIGTRADLR